MTPLRLREAAAREAPAREAAAREAAANDLTIVVTTSPIPSMPSTALLQALLKSLDCVRELAHCHIIIVCDGIGEVVGGVKPNWKCSRVNPEHVAAYAQYIANVQELARRCGRPAEVLVLPKRHGCGLAVGAALERVASRFVMPVQHDQLFLRAFDLEGVLAAMIAHPTLHYVGIQSRTTLRYKERVADRFGIALEEKRMPQLTSPLLPLLMWYDKPHIACVEHLRQRVYAGGVLRLGDFVEDVFGRAQMEDIKQHGIGAHAKYGTWVLSDDDESPVTYHLSGRKVAVAQAPRGTDEEVQFDAPLGASSAQLAEPEAAMWTANCMPIHAAVPGLASAVAPTAFLDADTLAMKRSGKFKGTCYRCQAKGHSFRFCPLNEGLDMESRVVRLC